MLATWQGAGPRRALIDVNGPPGANGAALYTSAYGPATPAQPGSFELDLRVASRRRPEPGARGHRDRRIRERRHADPADGRRPRRPRHGSDLHAEGGARPGQTVKIRLILKPAWPNVVQALGGGPVLVKAGRPVFRANEQFTPDQLLARTARSAVGQLADGRLLLVTVDGAQPGLQRGRDELRARPGAGQARRGHGGRARRRRLGDDGLRRPPAEQARPARSARSATRCSSSMPASTRRRRSSRCSRRTATASPSASGSRTSSSARPT